MGCGRGAGVGRSDRAELEQGIAGLGQQIELLRTSLVKKPALLELLVRSSAMQQLIYFTEDPDVSSWARVEALTGELSVLEPARPTERTADVTPAQIAV